MPGEKAALPGSLVGTLQGKAVLCSPFLHKDRVRVNFSSLDSLNLAPQTHQCQWAEVAAGSVF